MASALCFKCAQGSIVDHERTMIESMTVDCASVLDETINICLRGEQPINSATTVAHAWVRFGLMAG